MIIEHKKYELFGKLIFEKVILTPPFTKPNPMPNEACFFYIIEGETIAFSEVEELRCVSKESILMKCGNYISKMLPNQDSNIYHAFAVHFHPDILKKVYENDLPIFLKNPNVTNLNVGMGKVKNEKILAKYIDSFLFYFENPELVTEDLLKLKLKEIILLLNQTSNATAIREILSALFSPRSYTFKQIIESHIYSELSINEFAQLTNMSLSSFKREFKKVYDDSPANYIRNRKLEKAAQSILITDKRITEVVFECGFNDVAHFSKIFQDKYGMPPSQYRLSQKNKSLS